MMLAGSISFLILLRLRTGSKRFQSDPLKAIRSILQHRQKSIGLARHPHFSNNPARVIHNADARVLDRYVQSSKIVHAAILLLMLGARTTVTPFHHQPEAQHPKIFQLSTSRRPITPSFHPIATVNLLYSISR
jgi:hypothetical protein